MSQKSEEPEAPTQYEDRLVAFIDVMGWSELVRRGDHTQPPAEVVAAGELLANTLRTTFQMETFLKRVGAPGGLVASQFSDCVVFSVPAAVKHVFNLTGVVPTICQLLAEHGHLVRGAIVKGSILHTDKLLYGPALVDAYNIERSVAVYPRIVVAGDASVFLRHQADVVLFDDFDGLTCLDYLAFIGTDALVKLRDTFEAKASEHHGNLKLAARHNWFLHRLDIALARARNIPPRKPKDGDGDEPAAHNDQPTK